MAAPAAFLQTTGAPNTEGTTMFANFQSANPNKDFELPDVQEDGLSKMKFSPNANYLATCSWDNSVSVLWACVCAS